MQMVSSKVSSIMSKLEQILASSLRKERAIWECNVPDLASLGNVANVCVGSKVYNI
jgi:hypothetical protein